MVVVHRAFRREYRALPTMITAVGDGDTSQARLVGAHAAEMLDVLHHHHSNEDELLWPRLLACTTLRDDLIERMERQHERIATILYDVQTLLPVWQHSADPAAGRELAALFARAADELEAHLDEEEEHVLPLVEIHITAAEWDELGERGIAAMPKSRLLVFFGYLMEDTSAAERQLFLDKMPPPARVAFRLVGKRKHRREVARLRRSIADTGGAA